MAQRTERVYDHIIEKPAQNCLGKVKSALSIGPIYGLWALLYFILEVSIIWIVDLIRLESEIDILRNYDKNIDC